MKIAFFSAKNYEKKYFNMQNVANYHIDYFDEQLSAKSVHLAFGYDVICVFCNDDLNSKVILELSNFKVKLIALRCSGYDNVDLKVAHQKNIKIVNVPNYSPHSVAEHAISLIMALNRKIHKAHNKIKNCDFSLDDLTGFVLHNKTVGIIGFGNIGSIFANILIGFGCNVLVYDPYVNIQKNNIQFVNLEYLIQYSDIISLHCPLTQETYHLINKERISLMKNDVLIINVSRGAIIDTKALQESLQNGRIGGLAIDVYEYESNLFFNNLSNQIISDNLILELIMYPNVIITPHQGFLTHEALTQIANITYKNIDAFIKGQIINEVTNF